MKNRVLCNFVITALVYLFAEINARPEGGLGKHKVADEGRPIVLDPNIVAEMKKYKLEVLKMKILNEINLAEPPVVQTPVHVPRNILQLLDKNLEESESDESEELIVYPINEDFSCSMELNETSCSRFEFDVLLENRTVSSIHLWFHKVTPHESLFTSASFCTSSDLDDRNCSSQEVLSQAKSELGWTIFEIPPKLGLSLQNEYRTCLVEAYGSNFETKGNLKPFLVAYMNAVATERKRRSTRTEAGKICSQECCKIDFYVSFKEIGWDFVVAPAGFHANMCYGKCNNDRLNEFPSHYHRVMNLALTNKTNTAEKKEPLWTPCCSPTKLKPLNMIYKAANDTNSNSTHTLVHHEIQDMIAESCGCW